jgi:hypothetical protein
MSKKYYPEYGPVIHPVEVANRKYGRNGNSHAALRFGVFRGIVNLIKILSHYSFRWMDDKSGSGAKPSQTNVLTGGGDLREAQVDVPLSVSHTCV